MIQPVQLCVNDNGQRIQTFCNLLINMYYPLLRFFFITLYLVKITNYEATHQADFFCIGYLLFLKSKLYP
jgi:hypothetical protein